MRQAWRVGVVLLGFCMVCGTTASADTEPQVLWGRQFGTAARDGVLDLAVDSAGNSYVVGAADAKLGAEHFGGGDAIVVKYDNAGERLWVRQIGTAQDDVGLTIAISSDSHFFISGFTAGTLGEKNAGAADVFVAKYDKDGWQMWLRQFGTESSERICTVTAVPDAGCFVAGGTRGALDGKHAGDVDVFVRKYSADGKLAWKHQFGTGAREECLGGATVDSAGNCWVGGSTQGKLGGDPAGQADIFISKFAGDGRLLWVKQFGTDQDDVCHEVAADGVWIYLSGITWGRLGQDQSVRGNGDAFVAKCDDSGKVLWVRQFGTANRDAVNGMSLCRDGSGDVLLGGCQSGPQCQAFCRRYDSSGELLWVLEFSKGGVTCGHGVGMDKAGNCYHAGWTQEGLFGDNAGQMDGFLVKIGIKAASR